MSEKEKKKRALYRKNREKWIFTQTVIAVVIAVAILISSIVAYQLNKTYYIGYRESGSINYNVFLKDNEFFEDNHLGSNQSYVASLIDKIVADYSYEIDMDTDDVNYKYSYTIKSRLEIIDDTSEVAIFKPERELVSVQNKSQSSSNRLRINEIVVINYDEYNDLASKFLETYDLTSTTSNIVLTLEVDVLSDCNAFSGSSVDTYKSELRIPLTTKTVNIKMTSEVPDEEAKMIACTRGAGFEAFKTTAIVLGVIELLWILFMVTFIYLTRTEDVTYTARVKKITSQYKSYIQKINNMFDTTGYQRILVDKFDELLEIRDTIQAPILMHENEEKTCTKFLIPTDSKLLYVYEVKIEGYSEPEPTLAPAAEAPATVVSPNITNVIRPVVKVVVNTPPAPEKEEPQPVIETVLEEPEIEADEEVEVIATTEETEVVEAPEAVEEPETVEVIEEIEEVEEIEETDPEVEELIAAIPEVEEPCEIGVDVIDVRWKERPDKNYRYDPDGNTVEEGDVVLVPTRDEHGDKEVVREAEVARGNYKVDPETLDRPLKKIIGVVRRKAEKIFTAMITPAEENEDQN